MLAYHVLTHLVAVARPSAVPADPAGGGDSGGPSFTSVIPYVTGAGGALVVLLLGIWFFLTDKITTIGAVARLREADNNRFNDMVAQRDSLVKALEVANTAAAEATRSSIQALDLLRQAVGS